MFSNQDGYKQAHFIENYNHFVDEIKKISPNSMLDKLDEEGACDCLTKLQIVFAHEEKLEQFYFLLNYFNQLNSKTISTLAHQFINNETEKNNNDETNKLFDFINRIDKIIKSHDIGSFKSIEAIWENSITIKCAIDDLANELKKNGVLHQGKYKCLSTLNHQFSLIINKNEPAIFYDPNDNKKYFLCTTEEELANLLIISITRIAEDQSFSYVGVAVNTLYFTIENNEIERFLLHYSPIINSHNNIKLLIQSFREGNICQREMILALIEIIKKTNMLELNDLYSDVILLSSEWSNLPLSIDFKFVNCRLNGMGGTLIHFACENNQLSILRELIKSNNKHFDINIADYNGYTALHYAVRYARLEAIKMLIDSNAQLECKTLEGATPLHFATQNAHLALIKFLIHSHADINCTTDKGGTPLHIAIGKNNIELAKYLVFAGANINCVTQTGDTPLHYAVNQSNIELTRLLLIAGADVEIKNAYAILPLELAKKVGNDNIINLCDQHQKANEIVALANLNSTDCFPIKLYKMFNAYAHPPLLSFNWRTKYNMELADKLALIFKKNPDWDAETCQFHIAQMLEKENINQKGTFKGLLLIVEQWAEYALFNNKLNIPFK